MISGLKKIWNFADLEKSNLNVSVVFEFIYAIFNMLQIVAIYIVLNSIFSDDKNMKVSLIVLILLTLSIIGRSYFNSLAQLKQVHAGYFMVANKRVEIGKLLKTVPMGYFNRNNTAYITGITTSVLDDIENTAPFILVGVLSGLINSIVFTLMIFIFEFKLGCIVFIGTLLYLCAVSYMEKKSRVSSAARQKSQSELVQRTLEYIQGLFVIKAFNLEGIRDKEIISSITKNEKVNLDMEESLTPYIIIQDIIIAFFSVIMIATSLQLFFKGSMNISDGIMGIIMSFLAFNHIKSTGSVLATLRLATSSIEEVEKTMSMPKIDIDGKNIDPEKCDIEFNEVSFSYEDKKILKNISCKIKENTMTAIVGLSGSGKTTMCNLISRFWDVDKGSIKIGGIDIRKYKLESLMELISTVFQDVYLFEDTIENNIKFGKQNASHEEVVEAAKKARCHEFIEALPEGYDTIIGEGGASLSGGEKQRISIARAMLKDAGIIIFDEATANIDPENEDKLKEAIEQLTKNKTVIMIAHRLKTIRNADQILVLKDGEIVERGNHEELIKNNGLYSDLINAKAKAESWKLNN